MLASCRRTQIRWPTCTSMLSGDFMPTSCPLPYCADLSSMMKTEGDSLLDDLVSAGEQRRRHRQAEHPRGLGVNDQLELGRLDDRQVGRFCAQENAARIG